jgi:curved DNA-binding protein CbpA
VTLAVDTFELLPILAQGELAETSAPELVAAVFRTRASGTLWIETPEALELRVFFRAGDMCGATPVEAFHSLAHVLLSHDWVSALDIDSTREEAAASQRRHGEVLVEKALLTGEQLKAALRIQHTENLSRLFAVSAGRYEWRGWEPPPVWSREVADPGMALLDALAGEGHAARRRKVVEWLGTAPARLSPEWPDVERRLSFEPVERRALGVLAVPRPLADFVEASRLPAERAEALLSVLLLVGGAETGPERMMTPVTVTKARAQTPPEVEPVPRGRPRAPLGEFDLLDLDPDSPTQPLDAQANKEPVPELEPFEDLPFEPDAGAPLLTPREQEAVAKLDAFLIEEDSPAPEATAASPDELAEGSGPALELDHDPKPHVSGTAYEGSAQQDAASEERSRDLRKKLLARGLRNLGGAPSQVAPAEPPVEPPAQPAPSAPTRVTTEDRLFEADVADRLRRAPEQTAYARLGVAPNATQEMIKAAYLASAKKFHPDRAVGPLSSLQPDLERLFPLLKDAYENISSREARERYDEAQRAGPTPTTKTNSRKEESAVSVRMGDVLLKKRDFDGAIAKFRRAVDLDANGDAMAALAWALVADPRATNATKEEATALVNKALRADGVSARTYYVAGVFWRTKDPESAVEAFRKAVELDANHSDAALELRLIEQRRGKQKGSGGVLSGLLFGKRK